MNIIVSNKYSHFSEDTEQFVHHTEEEFLNLYDETAKEIPFMQNLEKPKLYFSDDMDALGRCYGSFFSGHAIYINSEVLTSKYSLKEKIVVIKHELGHYIADSIYKENCGHGRKWKKIMKAIGGEPKEYAPFAQYTITININVYDGDDIPSSEIYGYCTGCNKLIFKAISVDDYASALEMVLFATHPMGQSITSKINGKDFRIMTECCERGVYLVGSMKNMVDGAKNTGLKKLVTIIEEWEFD